MPSKKKTKSVLTARRARLDTEGTAEPLTRLVAKVPVGGAFHGNATHFEGEDGARVPLTISAADVSGYEPFLRRIHNCLDTLPAGTPIFTTEAIRPPSAGSAMDTFLEMLPAGEFRQHYNCRACAVFLNAYAGLVTIGGHGELRPVVWRDHLPIRGVFGSVWDRFQAEMSSDNRRVTGVFLSKDTTWGDTSETINPKQGFIQRHMSLIPPKGLVYSHPFKTAEQAMAEKREEYRMLQRNLARFTQLEVELAVSWLRSWKAQGDRVEHLHTAEWLLGVYTLCSDRPARRRENLVWFSVATAPTGFCHFASGVLGRLLERIQNKQGIHVLRQEYAQMLDPTKWLRPQAAPALGNVRTAEKIIERLGIARSMERRFARLEELVHCWTPKPAERSTVRRPSALAGGAFSSWARQIQEAGPGVHIEARLPNLSITWNRFQREILPSATRISCFVPSSRANFAAFVTACHPDAPPIIRWDSSLAQGKRNPVSFYVYYQGSLASQWGLQAGAFVDVKAVVENPSTWGGEPSALRGKAETFLILQGCHDVRPQGGLGLFPEILKSELHGVRATIEQYSKDHQLRVDPQAASGLHVVGANLEVVTPHSRQRIVIDRWD